MDAIDFCACIHVHKYVSDLWYMSASATEMGEDEDSVFFRLAQELAAWADTQPNSKAFHDAVFRAYFVEDRNINDIDELLAIAGPVGLDTEQAAKVLEERSFSEHITKNWERVKREGITSVPTSISRGQRYSGSLSYVGLLGFCNELVKPRDEAPD